VLFLGLVAVGWEVLALRLHFLPPCGCSPAVSSLRALACTVDALVLGFLAWWLWRGARWAAWLAVALLLVDALLIIQSQFSDLGLWVLGLTLLGGAAVASLLARPEAMKLL
ncbi:MAG: hypothetical protein VB080_06135, partial [Propionicimonas sp.]|uniref:hypothetical protein n=1 Tax=Propionicimonas sp. TaxID=1955623 RepID=UPI002B2039D4